MIPRYVSLAGVHGLPDIELHLNNDGLIAIAGPNGAGKSTLMAAMAPAILYRSFPDYAGSLASRFTGRFGGIETHIEHDGWGYGLCLKHKQGSISGYIDGTPDGPTQAVVIVEGKIREYDEAIAKRFPEQALVLASVYSAQTGAGDILSLSQAAQRDLLASLLGLDEIQAMWERAEAMRKSAELDVGILDDSLRRALDAEADVIEARVTIERCGSEATRLLADVETLRERRLTVVGEWEAERAKAERLQDLQDQMAKLRRDLASCDPPTDEPEDVAALEVEIADQARWKGNKRRLTSELYQARSELAAAQSDCSHLAEIIEDLDAQDVIDDVPCDGLDCPLLIAANVAHARLPDLRKQAEQRDAEIVEHRASVESLEERLAEAEAAIAKFPPDLVARLDHAVVAAAEDAGAIRARREGIETELATLGTAAEDLADPERPRRISTLSREIGTLADETERREGQIGHLKTEADRAHGRIDALGDRASNVEDLRSRLAAMQRRLAGFRLLCRGLGREGIQALEIDAAGPRISDLATSLLAEIEPRFALRIRTQRSSADGKRRLERLDVVVLDSAQPGVERTVADLSSGQRVVVSEALKLAIAVANAERWGVSCETLWRDECDGALDDEHARRYPAMLRRAMEIGGFKRCYYVSHRPSVVEQADSVIELGG